MYFVNLDYALDSFEIFTLINDSQTTMTVNGFHGRYVFSFYLMIVVSARAPIYFAHYILR